MNSYTQRIGIDARAILRPLRGIPLYVTRLCQYLPSTNRSILFYLFINQGYEHNDESANYMPRLDDIVHKNDNVRIVNHNDEAEILWEQYHLPRLVKNHKIDLLHMPSNRNCYFPGVPSIVTLHDMMEYLYLLDQKYPISWRKNKSLRMLFYNIKQRAYVVAMYKMGLKRASRIITVSNASAKDIKQHLDFPGNKVSVIHHGVDPAYFEKSLLPLHGRLYTLMMGGDSYQKNPRAAIAAWAKVNPEFRKKYPLKIIGFCGNDSSLIVQAIKEFSLENDVEVKGWVSQEEVVEHFRNAVLFLFPSRYEGFGFPLIQAMASGTPIISTNKSSIPEVLGTVGLQYDPDDENGITTGIEGLLSDVPFWYQQSKQGRLRSQMFTWENSASSHLDVYRELL